MRHYLRPVRIWGAGSRSEFEVKADPAAAQFVWDWRKVGEMELAGAFGGAGPLLRSAQPVDVEVAVGEGAPLGGVGDVVADLAPAWLGAAVMVEVGFESVGGVAPHGPTGRGPRHGSEDLDLPRCRSVEGFEDALGPCSFEGVVDHREVGSEIAAFGCGGGERPTTFLLMGVEDFESSPGAVLGFVGAVEPVAGPVDAVGGAADGVGVSSWPSLS